MEDKSLTSIDEVIIIYKVAHGHYKTHNDPKFIEVEFDPGHNSEDDYVKTIEYDAEDNSYIVTLRTGNALTPPSSIKFKDDCRDYIYEILDINVSNLTNIDGLFKDMERLEHVNIGSWFGTTINSMNQAFYNCPDLISVNLANCDLQYIQHMNEAFYGCPWLVSVDFGENTMPSLLDMESAFNGCERLTTIKNNWCLNYITNMAYAFKYCYNLEELDTTNWLKSPQNPINMDQTFYYCKYLEVLDASSWDTSTVTTMVDTFYNCYNLTTIIGQNNLNNVTDMTETFKYCRALVNIDVSNWGLNNAVNMKETFYDCKSLVSIDTTNWRLNNVDIFEKVFKDCISLVSVGDISNWGMSNATRIISPFDQTKIAVVPTLNWDLSKLEEFSLFCGMLFLVSIGDLTVLDVSNITSMNDLFYRCESLEEVDVTGWDVSKLQTANSFCYRCKNLKRAKGFETWRPKELQFIGGMFSDCFILEEVNLSGWYCPKLHGLSSLFESCEKLRTVDVTGLCCFDLDALGPDKELIDVYPDTEACFAYCLALENIIGLDTWIVSDIVDFCYMFEECYCLNEDFMTTIANWDTSNVGDYCWAFSACPNLGYVDLSKWSIDGLFGKDDWWNLQELFHMWYYDYDEYYAYCPEIFTPEDYNNIKPMTVDLSNLNFPASIDGGEDLFCENYHINNLILKNQPASLVNNMILNFLPDRAGMELSVGLIEVDEEIESEIDTEALEVLGWAIKERAKTPSLAIMHKDVQSSLYFKNKKAL